MLESKNKKENGAHKTRARPKGTNYNHNHQQKQDAPSATNSKLPYLPKRSVGMHLELSKLKMELQGHWGIEETETGF